jgi:hypothetical protein
MVRVDLKSEFGKALVGFAILSVLLGLSLLIEKIAF